MLLLCFCYFFLLLLFCFKYKAQFSLELHFDLYGLLFSCIHQNCFRALLSCLHILPTLKHIKVPKYRGTGELFHTQEIK